MAEALRTDNLEEFETLLKAKKVIVSDFVNAAADKYVRIFLSF